MKKPKLRQRAHKRSSMVLSTIGAVAPLALDQLPALQGILPNKWYIGLFLVMLVLSAIVDAHDE